MGACTCRCRRTMLEWRGTWLALAPPACSPSHPPAPRTVRLAGAGAERTQARGAEACAGAGSRCDQAWHGGWPDGKQRLACFWRRRHQRVQDAGRGARGEAAGDVARGSLHAARLHRILPCLCRDAHAKQALPEQLRHSLCRCFGFVRDSQPIFDRLPSLPTGPALERRARKGAVKAATVWPVPMLLYQILRKSMHGPCCTYCTPFWEGGRNEAHKSVNLPAGQVRRVLAQSCATLPLQSFAASAPRQ